MILARLARLKNLKLLQSGGVRFRGSARQILRQRNRRLPQVTRQCALRLAPGTGEDRTKSGVEPAQVIDSFSRQMRSNLRIRLSEVHSRYAVGADSLTVVVTSPPLSGFQLRT